MNKSPVVPELTVRACGEWIKVHVWFT